MIVDANLILINKLTACLKTGPINIAFASDFKKWNNIVWFMETCDFDIAVDSKYNEFKRSLKYIHSSQSFDNLNFWFRSLYDREALFAYITEILK